MIGVKPARALSLADFERWITPSMVGKQDTPEAQVGGGKCATTEAFLPPAFADTVFATTGCAGCHGSSRYSRGNARSAACA
jgi:hypothetical protein